MKKKIGIYVKSKYTLFLCLIYFSSIEDNIIYFLEEDLKNEINLSKL